MPVDIAGITITSENIIYACIGLFVLAIILWMLRNFLIRRAIFKLCGVPSSDYRLLGTNLTRYGKTIKLKKHNLYGVPGTVFLEKNGKTAYVCQYNPRDFKGRPKTRERYRMLLYMGLVKEEYQPENIKGAIRYHDHLEFINYEPDVYKKLLSLTDEYKQAIQNWEAPNSRPLFNRDNTI